MDWSLFGGRTGEPDGRCSPLAQGAGQADLAALGVHDRLADGETQSRMIAAARSCSTLSSLLTVGATVSVTGTTMPSMNSCSASSSALQSVAASSLTIGGQTIVIAGAGAGGPGPHGGPGGPGGPGH